MAVQIYEVPADSKNTLSKRFERKFYLGPNAVGPAYGILRQVCQPAREFPSEQINSLYFDTADLEQYERSLAGDCYKDKVRIRWYGDDKNLSGMQAVFLELKSKRGFAGTKQRFKLTVPAEALHVSNLGKGIVSGTLLMSTLARFGYFPSRMLVPVIKISYWRYRYDEIITGQRVSLDYHIRSTMIMPGTGNGEKELELPGGVIEVKGQTMEIPVTLRQVSLLEADWARFSKYSSCIDSHIERPGSIGRLSPAGRIVRI